MGFRESGFRNGDLLVVKHMTLVNERLTAQFLAKFFGIFYGPAPNMDPSSTGFGCGCATPGQAVGKLVDVASVPSPTAGLGADLHWFCPHCALGYHTPQQFVTQGQSQQKSPSITDQGDEYTKLTGCTRR